MHKKARYQQDVGVNKHDRVRKGSPSNKEKLSSYLVTNLLTDL